MILKLKNKEFFKNWSMDPKGEFYTNKEWKVPVDVVEHNKIIEGKSLRNTDSDTEIVTVADWAIPFRALNEESQIKLLNKCPEMFL